MKLTIEQATNQGSKAVNQDCFAASVPTAPLLTTKGAVIALADGISTSDVSHIASETAVKNFIADYYSTSEAWSVKTSAYKVLKALNFWLYAQSQQTSSRFNLDKGYVCTFSGLIIKAGVGHILHSGDSRIYRLVQGNLEPLTTDHRRYYEEEKSYLTKALGIKSTPEFDYLTCSVTKGDVFVLATDGVYEFLDSAFIAEQITQNITNLTGLATRLIDSAIAAGSDDNLTLQIVAIEQMGEQGLDAIQSQTNQLPLPPTLEPKQVFDGFEIIREIYISSRSHVFLAKQIETGKLVALKVPSGELGQDTHYLESFLMEDWIANRLRNHYLLKPVKLVQPKKAIYSVSEYIEGKNLAQWLRDNPNPTLDTVRCIVSQIAKGLQSMHRQEMVHRDLRPNNVMIDTDGAVKIIDFGATYVSGIAEVQAYDEQILGTAQFSAPEYFLGSLGSHQSDIYSLGVITYQLLTNRLPYGHDFNYIHNPKAQSKLRYHRLDLLREDMPSWIDAALNKAVAVNPQNRYQEVGEFIHDLHHPTSTSVQKHALPFIKRNPLLFWQALSITLTALLLIAALN